MNDTLTWAQERTRDVPRVRHRRTRSSRKGTKAARQGTGSPAMQRQPRQRVRRPARQSETVLWWRTVAPSSSGSSSRCPTCTYAQRQVRGAKSRTEERAGVVPTVTELALTCVPVVLRSRDVRAYLGRPLCHTRPPQLMAAFRNTAAHQLASRFARDVTPTTRQTAAALPRRPTQSVHRSVYLAVKGYLYCGSAGALLPFCTPQQRFDNAAARQRRPTARGRAKTARYRIAYLVNTIQKISLCIVYQYVRFLKLCSFPHFSL